MPSSSRSRRMRIKPGTEFNSRRLGNHGKSLPFSTSPGLTRPLRDFVFGHVSRRWTVRRRCSRRVVGLLSGDSSGLSPIARLFLWNGRAMVPVPSRRRSTPRAFISVGALCQRCAGILRSLCSKPWRNGEVRQGRQEDPCDASAFLGGLGDLGGSYCRVHLPPIGSRCGILF
jgi:hypothetical protein